MISIAIVVGLSLHLGAAVHLERNCVRGVPYIDLCDCDLDNWEWDNDDPNIHAIHRDCRESTKISSCYYGEWGVQDTNFPPAERLNSYGFTQWAVLEREIDLNDQDDIDNPPFIELEVYPVHLKFRLWSYCDFEPNQDTFQVYLYDNWLNTGNAIHDPLDDEYGRQRSVFENGEPKRRESKNNCDGWTEEVNEGNLEFWDELTCAQNSANRGASCYYDYDEVIPDVNGSYIRIRWETSMDEQPTDEQWAFSNLELCVGPECPGIADNCPCCKAEEGSNNAEARRCKVFRESGNCDRAGCVWQSTNPRCNYPCCRKLDPASKEKPKCKTLNDNLNRCGNQRDDCYVSTCDCQGFFDNGDAFDIPDGQDVCPPFSADERQCFHEYPVDPQPNVGRDN